MADIPRSFVLVLCLTLGIVTCTPAKKETNVERFEPESLSGTRAYAETREVVAIGPRPAGSDGALRTVNHIAQRLKQFGIDPEVDAFDEETPLGTVTFRNVIARLPGTTTNLIVIAGHYDTKSGISPRFVGANDAGSSTGLLLALAETLKRDTVSGPSIMLAFLDGEECRVKYDPRDGLHGSRRLAAKLVADNAINVQAVIVVDMIGDKNLTVTLPRNVSARLMQLALKAAHEEGAHSLFMISPGGILDDHVPFLEKGIPAIDLIDFQFGSAPGLNDYWHTEEDTMDKLSPESLETVGRVVIRMINALL